MSRRADCKSCSRGAPEELLENGFCPKCAEVIRIEAERMEYQMRDRTIEPY